MAQLMTELTSPQPGQETRSAVERIAAFAAAARPEQLAPDIRQLFKRNILDSIGCAIAALPGPPFQALREQFEEYRARWPLHIDWRRQDLGGSGSTIQLRPRALCRSSRQLHGDRRPLSSE